jgi:hypothetical protein
MRVATGQDAWRAAAVMVRAFAEHAPLYAMRLSISSSSAPI